MPISEEYKVPTYGKSDQDKTAENELQKVIEAMGREHLKYIVLHPRMPVDARICQLPGSLLVQAVFLGGVVKSVRQSKPGGPAVQIQ